MIKGRVAADGHRFHSEAEYRRYRGLMALQQSGRIRGLRIHPEFPLDVNGYRIGTYTPSFVFFDPERQSERIVQAGHSANNPTIELRIRLFEALYRCTVERWA